MPSIDQFRSTVYNITKAARYHNEELELPVLKAIGTVKLHGTNASVCYNSVDGIWFQSKKKIITPEKDNAGFAFFGNENLMTFRDIILEIESHYRIDCSKNTVTVYGEWAGEGIQGSVAISKLQKSFYIFGVKISPFDEDAASYWVDFDIFDTNSDVEIDNIHCIKEFRTFDIEIDFNNPGIANNKMVDMVKEVEDECPVAKQLGVSGIGEGIVFETSYKGSIYRWKMKGDKHSGKSRVKKAKKVDNTKLQLIYDTVEKVTPEWRLDQMYQETFDTLNGGRGDIKKTGDYIRSIITDITKEDSIIISEAGLIPKDINKFISKKARLWLMSKLDEEAGI